MRGNSFRKNRILIVEPSAEARRALIEILRAEGHSLIEAEDGYQALEILRQRQVDLAILDADASEPSGTSVLQQCRRLGLNVPIVLAAPSWNVRRAVAAVKAEAADYLAKPYNRNDVVEVLHGILDASDAHDLLCNPIGQAQKLEAVGRLAGGVVHDFNNLLTVILGYGDLLHDLLPSDDPAHEYAEEISKAAEQGAALTAQLLALSRTKVVEPAVLNLNDVIRRGESLLRRFLGDRIDLKMQLDPDLGAIRADATQINQLIMNLAINARDAMTARGTLTVRTHTLELPPNPFEQELRLGNAVSCEPRTFLAEGGRGPLNPDAPSLYPPSSGENEWKGKFHSANGQLHLDGVRGVLSTESALRAPLPPGSYIVLTIQDTGCGMDGPTRARLFELFFTTKRQGTGLGLATVHNIVRQSRGYITVDSAPGQGTSFTIYFPRVPACGFAPASSPAVALPGDETILLLESDPAVRNLIRLTLETNGYTVLEADSANDALYLAADYRGSIHLMISNLLPPDSAGADLTQRAVLARPGLKFVFFTGHSTGDLIDQTQKQGHLVLQKPFTPETLLAKVREALLKRDVRNVG